MKRRGVVLATLYFVPILGAADWPAFRGPAGNGTSDDANVPLRWSETDNVCWKVPVPGRGHSSPIIWGDRIFLNTCLTETQERVLHCFDRRDGRLVWQRKVVTAPIEQMHDNNTAASSTPVADGQHVWVTFLDAPKVIVACFDIDGQLAWKRAVGGYEAEHGFASSPVLHGDLLIVNGDSDGDAFLTALDKRTGAERWRVVRPNRTRSFSTPIFIDAAGRRQMVLSGSKSIASYDPASGRQYWVVDSTTDKFVATPAYADGIVFATGTSPNQNVVGIRPDGTGNVTATHVAWNDHRGAAYVPSPVAFDKCVFLVSDTGVANCFEARTGRPVWTERLGSLHRASPLLINNHIYCLANDGVMFVLKASTQFEVVSRNRLDGECHATPAIADGQLFVRTTENLYCIGRSDRRGEPERGKR
jgi:outer membrane protein assembly factor BamB